MKGSYPVRYTALTCLGGLVSRAMARSQVDFVSASLPALWGSIGGPNLNHSSPCLSRWCPCHHLLAWIRPISQSLPTWIGSVTLDQVCSSPSTWDQAHQSPTPTRIRPNTQERACSPRFLSAYIGPTTHHPGLGPPGEAGSVIRYRTCACSGCPERRLTSPDALHRGVGFLGWW